MRLHTARRPVLLALASCLGLFAVSVTGCVDTKGAMDSYIERTQGLRDEYKPAESDASVSVDAQGFEGNYVMFCLSPLVGTDTSRTLRFKATIKYAPTAPGAGPLTMQLQPLVVGATTVAAPIGPVFPAAPGATAEVKDGKFLTDLGNTPDLPAEANPLTGVRWGIDGLELRGALTSPPESFCASLAGFTRPSGLSAEGARCLFFKTKDDAEQVAVPEAAAFTCPR